MKSAPHLFNEDARLAALAQYDLQSDEPVVELDDIVQLAKRFFDVPIVLVSIVERSRQIFRAHTGVDVCETARDISFCAHALSLPCQDMLIIPDAQLDIRFADNPLVTAAPFIRFYAGVPLRAPDGHALGTLCIIDHRPRSGLSSQEQHDLKTFAAVVLDRLEMRRLDIARAASQSRFENIAATSPDGIVCTDHTGAITFWNASAEALFGFSEQEAVGSFIDIIVPERMRDGHNDGMRRVTGGGAPRLVGKTVELTAANKQEQEFPVELSLSMWRHDGLAHYGAIIRNITERRQNEERLFRLAHHDGLTGLANRTVLTERISDCIAAEEGAAVLMIDLDRFKDVNDTLGHGAGDAVLQRIARRLRRQLRENDVIARWGGDEFAVLMPGCRAEEEACRIADALIDVVVEPVRVEEQLIQVSASVGIALYPDHGDTAEMLLSAADLAMYQAKAEGRDCRRMFTPRLKEAALGRFALAGEVRRALDHDEFELFYQPQVDVAGDTMRGVEALLRWHHPTEGLLTPGRFLQSIQSSQLAPAVGAWTLTRACADGAVLRRRWPDLVIGVNLFGAQFRTGDLAADVEAALERSGLPPQALELEITEDIILRHDETMLLPLQKLKQRGVGIAFDDFGTGFASLSMLKRYPLTRIKIDRSFVQDICTDTGDAAIVSAMVQLAQGLDIDVIAEGVEEIEQRDLLVRQGCAMMQGYLLGRPVPLAQLVGARPTMEAA
ncbi:EAL domain-containing protein [uncultured Sphingomonas sp.]|uniref:putative bifunctional diguanylate cyclase/phosphodiesterase n=1 Tax=uncultured Sphingomonas sp. TaxID=158754 RepID=UPI0025E8FFBF|nr:EAL domain-containing protein [uncultured Sphingomonas sp.]